MTGTVVHLRPTQLTLDGREVLLDTVGRLPAPQRLGVRQRDVMRALGLRGSIRAVQAGTIAHRGRGHCGFGNRDVSATGSGYEGEGCCRYASTDGSAILKSLAQYGLVETIGGVYYRVHDAG